MCKVCTKKVERIKKRNERHLERTEAEFDKANRKIAVSNHFLQRLNERSISPNEVKVAIEEGWLIDTCLSDVEIETSDGEVVTKRLPKFILLGYYKLPIGYQPLHVVIAKDYDGSYIGLTAYNPFPEIWGESYDEKKCFCRSTYNDNYEYM